MTVSIVVVGSLNMDLVVRSPRIPVPGETIIGGDLHTFPGGKGANQAVAAARLGARVSMIGRVGNDTFAGALLENLAAGGVDPTHVGREVYTATGVALIVVDDRGQNSIVISSGANMKVNPADVEAAEAVIAAADLMVLQLEVPLDSVVRSAELARAHGVPVVLNPAPAQPLPRALLSAVDVLVPNESEAELLTGLPAGTPAGAEAAARALLDLGLGTVILTLGERGALTACQSGMQLVPAFEVQPVDTTAAGDAFVGGLSVALAEGAELVEAVRWGNAAGALAASRLGAQPSLPGRQELQKMLAAGRQKPARWE